MRASRLCIAVCALILAVCGCPRRPAETENPIETGKAHFQRRDLARAAAAFERAVQESPDDPEACALLADTYIRMRNAQSAVTLCTSALERKPGDIGMTANLGRAHLLAAELAEETDPAKCKEELDAAERLGMELIDKKAAHGFLLVARVAWARGKRADAMTYLQDAIGIDADYGAARLALGDLYMEMALAADVSERADLLGKAAAEFRKVIECDAALAYTARRSLAEVAIRSRKYAQARTELEQLLKESPKDVEVLLLLGRLKIDEGKPDEALALAKRAGAVDANAPTALVVGMAHYRKSDFDKAEAPLTESARRWPKDPTVQLMLGDVLKARRSFEQAITHYRVAVSLAPRWVAPRFALATCQAEHGDETAAIRQLETIARVEREIAGSGEDISAKTRKIFTDAQALRLSLQAKAAGRTVDVTMGRRDFAGVAKALDLMAVDTSDGSDALRAAAEKLRGKEPDAAVKMLREATRTWPDSACLWEALAEIHVAEGRIEEALRVLNEAERNTRGAATIHEARARAYRAAGRSRMAIQELRKALAVDPRSVNARRYLGGLLAAEGDAAAALALFAELQKELPDNEVDARNLAEVYVRMGRYEKARTLLQAILDRDPDNIPARLKLADIHRRHGDVDMVWKHLAEVLKTEKTHAVGFEMAVLKMLKRQYTGAASLARELLAADSPHPNRKGLISVASVAWSAMGARSQVEAALAHFDALAEAENSPKERRSIRAYRAHCAARAYAALGQQAKLEALVAKAQADLDRNDVLGLESLLAFSRKEPEKAKEAAGIYGLALLLHEAGWPKLALAKAGELTTLAPEWEEGVLLQARFQLGSGKAREADEALRRLIRSVPSARAHVDLAGIAEWNGRSDEAAALYKKALALESGLELPYLHLGLMAEARGKPSEAVAHYEEAVRRVPNSVLARNQLAWLYSQQAETKARALELARKAHSLDPESGPVADTLGWLCFLSGRNDDAVKYLKDASARSPRSAEIRYHLGKAQAAKGDIPAAIRSFETALLLSPRFEGAEEAERFLAKNR